MPHQNRYLFLVVLFVLLSACGSEPHSDYIGPPIWGPIAVGDCVDGEAARRYTANLHGASNACQGPFNNVMGAHFNKPTACEGKTGMWHVKDLSCSANMPTLPGVGPDNAPSQTAEGFADLHNHLLAHIAFGETVLWGASYGEPKDALKPIPESLRKSHQRVEALSSTRSITGIFDSHEEDGHPSYNTWPSQNLKTHQQTHVDWLYRAYQGGLRLAVVTAENNQDMFGRGETRLSGWQKALIQVFGSGAVPADHRTSNDMEALEHQIRAAHKLVAWVAEHRGGWLEIAETPEEASSLIKQGKMALVLGSEVDHPLNCDLDRRCSKEHIKEGLTKLEALGIVVIFPTHHKENQFGDSANFQPLNSGPLRPCPAFTADCAALGLLPKGEFLVQEMMSRGMLVDLGHAGDKPFDDTMTLFEAENYPTFMTHASAHPLKPNGSEEYTLTYQQLRRIDQVGGMISVHSAMAEYAGVNNQGAPMPFVCTDGGGGYTQSYLYSRDALDGAYMQNDDLSRGGQLSFAPDWNGFAGWPQGRFGPRACERKILQATGEPISQPAKLNYPLTLPTNLLPAAVGGVGQLPVMQFEGKQFDFNISGLAQAGLQPDLLADMRLHGLSAADLDPLYRSARGFIDMWQRARDMQVENDRGWLRWLPPSPTDLIEFDYLDEQRIVEVSPGVPLCRYRATGAIGSLVGDRCQLLEGEQVRMPSSVQGEIRNSNSGQCLTADSDWVTQTVCNDAAQQQWQLSLVDQQNGLVRLSSVQDERCLLFNAGGTKQDSSVNLANCADVKPVTLERIGNTFRFKSEEQRCLQIEDRQLKSGAKATVANCPPEGRADFHWEIDSLRQVQDVDRLFSTRALSDTIAWLNTDDTRLPYAVTSSQGASLCRIENQLGVVINEQCSLRDGTRSTQPYQVLRSATALRHD